MLADLADATKQERFSEDGVGVLEVVMCTELVPQLADSNLPDQWRTSVTRVRPAFYRRTYGSTVATA